MKKCEEEGEEMRKRERTPGCQHLGERRVSKLGIPAARRAVYICAKSASGGVHVHFIMMKTDRVGCVSPSDCRGFPWYALTSLSTGTVQLGLTDCVYSRRVSLSLVRPVSSPKYDSVPCASEGDPLVQIDHA